jgi:hypothetical protein
MTAIPSFGNTGARLHGWALANALTRLFTVSERPARPARPPRRHHSAGYFEAGLENRERYRL